MDASSITDDNTGASNTSPVPTGQTYVDIIMKAAAQTGVNPYVLGAMILQEQESREVFQERPQAMKDIITSLMSALLRRDPCLQLQEDSGMHPSREVTVDHGIPLRSPSLAERPTTARIS